MDDLMEKEQSKWGESPVAVRSRHGVLCERSRLRSPGQLWKDKRRKTPVTFSYNKS